MYQALGKYMGKIFLKNFLTIFLISKKIFVKFENFLKNDSASEKSIKNRIPNIYGIEKKHRVSGNNQFA